MRKKMVAGNWKMYGNLLENKQLLAALVAELNGVREDVIVVCVPYVYLPSTQNELQNTTIAWGAQNVSQYEKGAYTGEISASMLSDFQCKYVIVGHSERRMLFGEDNDVVAEKYVAAQRAGITPILCVGETLEQREAKITEQVIEQQLMSVINVAGIESLSKAVIAYEPVWAIGTGKTASPEQAQEVHAFIRAGVAKQNLGVANQLIILYGGSVKANNAPQLFAMPDIDGGLIGGASLIASEFITICRASRH
ncbi:triose-phosphate isomerase [Nitrosomonas supralitoralis]|uniref:Triosephosphate isomerase n=1 Tax=Nitrosomonas supralitoralis TaxID=2116706 RepID=A0A2P7NTK9_9PROT|nr:triose-phosphate isomerase [Nitrosomonas supralitoralis]PSJ16769.1 triose-phosphate isomerase [Nitrosomonas supralitoralis]